MLTEEKVMLFRALRHKKGFLFFKEAHLCEDRLAIQIRFGISLLSRSAVAEISTPS